MPIAGDHPETGIRVVLERPRGDVPPFRFVGHVYDPKSRVEISAVIDAAGEVEVRCQDDDLAGKVRLLMRAACKHATAEGRPPPLRIQRWRGEK